MLAEHVLYRIYSEYVYILDTRTSKSYVFDGIAVDLIDLIAGQETLSVPVLSAHIENLYGSVDSAGVQEDVRWFLEVLEGNGLLRSGSARAEQNGPEEIVDRFCMHNRILTSVLLELTYRCNEQCRHCYTVDAEKRREDELTLAEYRKLMDELREMDVRELVLSGGEIGMRDDFADIYRYAVDHDFLVTLMTNGTAFTEDQMELFLQRPPKVVYISFYGGSAQVHDSITRLPGSFDRSLRTLMRLKCAGILVSMKTVAMTLNREDYPNLVKLAQKLRVGLGTGMFVTSGNNGSLESTQYRLQGQEAYEEIIFCKQKYRGAYTPWRERDLAEPVCEAGLTSFTINPYGDMMVCTSLPISCGNVRTRPIREFWNGDPLLERIRGLRFRDLGEPCVSCQSRNECVYCFGSNYVEHGKLTVVQPEVCQAARAFHRSFQKEGKYPREPE